MVDRVRLIRSGEFPARPATVVRVSSLLPRVGYLPSARWTTRQAGKAVALRTPTDQQWAAARATDRHVLVSAGAGTGKTNTVLSRILYLLGVEIRGVSVGDPIGLGDVAAITFTNAAAADLKHRLRQHLREGGRREDSFLVDAARIGTIRWGIISNRNQTAGLQQCLAWMAAIKTPVSVAIRQGVK